MGILLGIACAFPFLLLAPLAAPATRALAVRIAPWAALPALAVGLAGEGAVLDMPWLMLGGSFTLDPLARGFLVVSAALWLAAGIYARGYLASTHDPRAAGFFGFFLGTMGGNLCLIPAQDLVSYVAFFAIMSYSAYGLVVHRRSRENFFAARVYIGMAVVGELAAFAGLVWAAYLAGGDTTFEGIRAAVAATPGRGAILLLVFLGFGIKLGVMPLHVWLPLAHPAAPTPASAVLSGVMIKTGLLLWLRVFAFGGAAAFGGPLIALGLFTAFCAALMGMTQTHPKSLLAYSSISQMGLAATGAGIGLVADSPAVPVAAVLLVFTAHHALAKGALFLGTGIAACELGRGARWLVTAGFALSGAALAGVPFTSGLAAKAQLKDLAQHAGDFWAPVLAWLLPLTGITTALLLIRLLFLVAPRPREAHGRANPHMVLPWAVLTLATLVFPWAILAASWAGPKDIGFYRAGMTAASWPVLVAVGAAVVVVVVRPLGTRLAACTLPAGDVVYPVLGVLAGGRRLFALAVARPAHAVAELPVRLRRAWTNRRGGLLQRLARQESFALGMLVMGAVVLVMAFIL